MAETEGMDEATANTYFCKMPVVRKGVFRDERLQLPIAGGPQNSKYKCKKWMKNHNSVEAGSLEQQEENWGNQQMSYQIGGFMYLYLFLGPEQSRFIKLIDKLIPFCAIICFSKDIWLLTPPALPPRSLYYLE